MVSTITAFKCSTVPMNFATLASEILISRRSVIPFRRRFIYGGDTLMAFNSATCAYLHFVPLIKAV